MDTVEMTTLDSNVLWPVANSTATLMNDSFLWSAAGNETDATDDHTYSPQLTATFMAVYFSFRVLWSCLTIFGNVLVIVAVVRFDALHNTSSYLICSLAIADLIGGSLTPLLVAHQTLTDSPAFIPLCLIEKTISMISTANSVFSILWIAVDRYIYMAYPLRYSLLVTPITTFSVVGCSWFLSSTELIVLILIGQNLQIGMTCKYPVFLSNFIYNKIIIPQLIIVALITVSLYVAIGRIAYKQGVAIAALNQPFDTHAAASNRTQKKITKMMGMVLGTFFACYIPQAIANEFLQVHKNSVLLLQLEKITVLIYWANTWINPIIYAWNSKDFNKAFRKLLGLKSSHNNNVVS